MEYKGHIFSFTHSFFVCYVAFYFLVVSYKEPQNIIDLEICRMEGFKKTHYMLLIGSGYFIVDLFLKSLNQDNIQINQHHLIVFTVILVFNLEGNFLHQLSS